MSSARGIKYLHSALRALHHAGIEFDDQSNPKTRLYAGSIARDLERLIPLAEREARGEVYKCRCCGIESFTPFGLDETICGPCHNGIHDGHEPPANVGKKLQ